MTETESGRVSVIVADDVGSTRRFLRGVLEDSGLFDVVGEAEDGAQVIELSAGLRPDVVLLDLSMPGGEGTDVLRGLMEAVPEAAVILLSGRNESEATPLLDLGAKAFVQKGLPPWELVERLTEILALSAPASSSPTSPASVPAEESASSSTDGGPRAVVCDDDAMTRRLVGQVLSGCGVTVVADTDIIPNLVSVVGLSKPDLVVLDLWLEGTTGLSALPDLRAASPGTTLIVYSGRTEWRDRALAGGAAVFVDKPNFDELQVVVRRLIKDGAPPR